MMELDEKVRSVRGAILSLLTKKKRLLVAIDGRCGAGKSTLAAALHDECGYPVVHMDDFFLRPVQRTEERLATPGGNVDHERFLAEVLEPLAAGEPATYRPFLCRTMTLGEETTVSPAAVILVEGSYACHPQLRDRYDLRIFLDVDPETQLERIRRRNGEEKAEEFRTRWIPLEELYFSALDVADHCQLILK